MGTQMDKGWNSIICLNVFITFDPTLILDLDIKYIAIPRTKIKDNKDLLKRLKNNGIKAYAFYLYAEPGTDENYVFQNEMEWIAGMYADDLDLILNPP